MAAKFFGQFLLESGLIDSQQLLRALELQRESNPVLGELAQARGWLTATQAERINERQRAQDKRFGDIAEELGLLTQAQVGELLDEQKSRRRFFGEILVDEGMLSRRQVDAALAEHQNDRADAVQSLAAGVAGHPLGGLASRAVDTCAKLFPRLVKVQCQLSGLLDAGATVACDTGAEVRIEGGRSFGVSLACDRATATALAAAFLGIPAAECDDALADDALGELVNVLMGYVVKDTMAEDTSYRASPPRFVHGADAAALGGATGVRVALTSQLGSLMLAVAA